MFANPSGRLVLWLGCSIALLGLAVHMIREEDAFRAHSIVGTARITSAYQTARSAALWQANYSFSTPDDPVRFYAGPTRRAEKDMFFSKPTIGSEVQVRYLPDDPAHNAISTTEPLRWKAYFAIGVGIIALWGTLLAYRDVRAYRRW